MSNEHDYEAQKDDTGAESHTEDHDHDDEDEEEEEEEEEGLEKPDTLLDTRDLSKRAMQDREASQRGAATLSGRIGEIVNLDALDRKQHEKQENFRPAQKPVRSLFSYGLVKSTDRVSGIGSWMEHKLSDVFTRIENWGTETLEKNAKWIGWIPFLGSWLLGKPEKSLAEREKDEQKEKDKHEKEAKTKNKEAARKLETKQKEDERKLKASVEKANRDYDKRNKPKERTSKPEEKK